MKRTRVDLGPLVATCQHCGARGPQQHSDSYASTRRWGVLVVKDDWHHTLRCPTCEFADRTPGTTCAHGT